MSNILKFPLQREGRRERLQSWGGRRNQTDTKQPRLPETYTGEPGVLIAGTSLKCRVLGFYSEIRAQEKGRMGIKCAAWPEAAWGSKQEMGNTYVGQL